MSKNLIDCVNTAIKDGSLSKEAGEDIKDFYQRELTDKGRTKQEAAKEALANADYETKRKKFNKVLQAQTLQKMETHIDNYMKNTADATYKMAMDSLMTKDPRFGTKHTSNVESRADAINGMVAAKFTDAMDDMRSKMGGFKQDTKMGDDVIREIFGTDSGSPKAKLYSKAWADVAEELRQLFNGAGGAIGKLSDWGMPQRHDQFKISRVSFDDWNAKISDYLDFDKMGVAPKDRLEYMQYVHDTIVTGGLNKLEVGKLPKGISSAKANAHREHRTLFFKDGDSWLKYQKEFGTGDAYNAMTDHIRSMSMDISLMEIFGPNPQKNFDYLIDVGKKDHGMGNIDISMRESIFNVVSGKVDNTAMLTKKDFWATVTLGGIRSLNVLTMLGSATISAIGDGASIFMNAGVNNMSGTKMFLKGLRNLGQQDRIKTASMMGIVADGWNGSITSRYSELAIGKSSEWAERLLRVSGLNLWTDAHRKAFSMELMGKMDVEVKKGWDNIDKGFKKTLENNGFSKDDFDLLKQAESFTARGEDFVSIENISQLHNKVKGVTPVQSRELSLKILEFTKNETDIAVITPDATTRAITTGGREKGTLQGEGIRSLMQFKSFPIAVMLAHYRRMMSIDNAMGKTAYTAKFMTLGLIFGGVALWANDIIKGKDPQKIDEGFAVRALLKSGGAGLFGDFILQDQNRFGGDIVDTIAGPTFSRLKDLSKLISKGVYKKIEGEDSNFLAELAKYGKSVTPAQNLWYIRAILERAIFDEVRNLADPMYKVRKMRRQAKEQAETGNDFYWGIGETLPSRSPKFNVLEK